MKRSGFIMKNFISLVENVPLDKRAFGIRLQEHGMYDNKHGRFLKIYCKSITKTILYSA